MKRLAAALMLGACALAPLAASAQTHGGGHAGGGYHGGGYHGGYGGYRGGWGGYRGGWGYGGWGYGGWGWGAFGLGLALGSAWDPWYGGYYYPGYYSPYYYSYAPGYSYDEDAYDYGPPPAGAPGPGYAPPAGSAPPTAGPVPSSSTPQKACGQWVWRADQNKYEWNGAACS